MGDAEEMRGDVWRCVEDAWEMRRRCGDAWEMRRRCVGDAWVMRGEMRGRCVGDAWEMRGRCVGAVLTHCISNM